MDLATLVTSVVSSLSLSLAAAGWLARELIQHRLKKALEANKAELNRDLERLKAEWQGQIRKEVEDYLGERAAEREYTLEARKRLYSAIGPLRFQLLLACRDIIGRILTHAQNEYSMAIGGYYGMSTLYRLLRPLAIADLIEQQIAYADFSVDPSAIELLRFKRSAFSAFTGERAILNHPKADWSYQKQHIFVGNLTLAAKALIQTDKDGQNRIMESSEFKGRLMEEDFTSQLTSLPQILNDFSIRGKPLFWARLVCYGFICSEFLRKFGSQVGLEPREYDAVSMIEQSSDDYFLARLDKFESVFREIAEDSL